MLDWIGLSATMYSSMFIIKERQLTDNSYWHFRVLG